MRRHLTAFLLCAALPLSAAACSSGSSESKPDETPTESTSETTSDEAAIDSTAPADETASEPAEEEVDLATADLDALFSVTGNGDKDQIKGVIGQRKPDVFKCYQQELPNSPGLAGRVLMKITTAADGSVVSAIVSQSTLDNRPVETCMTKTIRAWKFPEDSSGGLVVIEYPFVLPP